MSMTGSNVVRFGKQSSNIILRFEYGVGLSADDARWLKETAEQLDTTLEELAKSYLPSLIDIIREKRAEIARLEEEMNGE